MSPEQQRIAIAEWCGWRIADERDRFGNRFWKRGEDWRRVGEVPKTYEPLPDYPNDLNAIHEAEDKLSNAEHNLFRIHLSKITTVESNDTEDMVYFSMMNERAYISATARQRSEALLKIIGKWKD